MWGVKVVYDGLWCNQRCIPLNDRADLWNACLAITKADMRVRWTMYKQLGSRYRESLNRIRARIRGRLEWRDVTGNSGAAILRYRISVGNWWSYDSQSVRLAGHHESDTGDPIRSHSIRLILDRMSGSPSCTFEMVAVAIPGRIKRYLRLMQIWSAA